MGKTYLATADNIARFTNGRFIAAGLSTTAQASIEPATPPNDLPPTIAVPVGPVGLLIGEDDLHPESLALGAATVSAIASAEIVNDRTDVVHTFISNALADARDRASRHFGVTGETLAGLTIPAVRDWAQQHNLRTVVTAYAPVGPGRTAIDTAIAELAGDGISLVQVRRAWDSAAWPEARRDFFAFREKAAALIA